MELVKLSEMILNAYNISPGPLSSSLEPFSMYVIPAPSIPIYIDALINEL